MSDSPLVEPARPEEPRPEAFRLTALDVIRFVVELFAIFTFGFWGFTAWPFAWNILAGIGAPVLAIVVWGLFVSPRAVVRVHPFVAAAIELVVFAAATVAWWTLGQVWIGLAFAVVAVVSGALVGRRRLS